MRDAELFARQSILLVGEPYAARVLTILSNQPVRKYLKDNNIPANAEIQAVPIMSHLLRLPHRFPVLSQQRVHRISGAREKRRGDELVPAPFFNRSSAY